MLGLGSTVRGLEVLMRTSIWVAVLAAGVLGIPTLALAVPPAKKDGKSQVVTTVPTTASSAAAAKPAAATTASASTAASVQPAAGATTGTATAAGTTTAAATATTKKKAGATAAAASPAATGTTTALAAPPAGVAAAPIPKKGCVRLGFSVNDYGKDGPTKDALKLLDTYIVSWTAEHSVKTYKVGPKSVECQLFLNFIVFDEHTCTASANVCY